MIRHVINTVGTSLLENLRRVADIPPELTGWLDRKDAKQLAKWLAGHQPEQRECGAEINSIHHLEGHSGLVADATLHFCVSQTPEGKFVAAILNEYYLRKNRTVRLHEASGLQDADPQRFRREGLRQLVRIIGTIIRNEAGGPAYTLINATGGYKAQIAIAVVLGQALGVPVHYKHERFPSIISLPPLPITFDYSLLTKHSDLLDALEQEGVVKSPASAVPDSLQVLLEHELVDGLDCWAMTAISEIYLEGYRLRFPAEKTLPPSASTENRKAPTFRDDHYPKGFQDYVERIWRENPWILSAHSLPYDRQPSIRDRTFYIGNDDQLTAEYRDRNNFGAREAFLTTAKTNAQREAAVWHLTQRYGRD